MNFLQVMQAPMIHSPSHMIAQASAKSVDKPKAYLIQTMGAVRFFDYELSIPRYFETPETLWKLAQNSVQPLRQDNNAQVNYAMGVVPDVVKLALQFQDIKEHTKHESLHVFAILRKVLRGVDQKFGNIGLVFYLYPNELSELKESNLQLLKNMRLIGMKRHNLSKNLHLRIQHFYYMIVSGILTLISN
ncbi:MAG: hypothetical protein JKX71_09350 [Amylibacter sp.]|nr:hypothetical protein [Amylibacter sp.]